MTPADDLVIKGFQTFDADITKEYFYGYCRRAYLVLDNKYQLHNKVGLDFYSLAHEYYLQLLSHDFKQLTDRPKKMKLSAFMFKGFWFVTMDALKAHKKSPLQLPPEGSDLILEYVRASNKEEGMMEQIAEAVSHYYKDRTMSHLAWELFVLGYKQNEVSAEVGLTPSAVNQRYKKMMEEVVTPFVIENYGSGIYLGKNATCDAMPCPTGVACEATADIREMYVRPYADKGECSMTKESINMANPRITPEFITSLKENEIFVFGSNLRGIHAGGAAHMAHVRFGAEMGNGVGIQGQCYAIPTMQGLCKPRAESSSLELCRGAAKARQSQSGVETIKPYVDQFLAYASQHKELHFLVTPIGCGIAGFEPEDIAPLFEAAKDMENVSLPESFWDCLAD